MMGYTCQRLLLSAAVVLIARGSTAGTVVADYTLLPNGQAPSYGLAGTLVTGSNDVTLGDIGGLRGLGIFGGTFPPTSDLSVDLNESISIDYGQLVSEVTLQVVDVAPAGNVEYQFEAFNGVVSLGSFAVPLHTSPIETKNLTDIAGGVAFTRFVLAPTASAPAGVQIQATSYTPVPEPTSLATAMLASLLFFKTARR